MSARFVSKPAIDLLVSAMRELGSHARIGEVHDRADRIDPDRLGRILWSENVKSLRSRYPTDRDVHRACDRQVQAYSFTEYRDIRPGPIAALADFYDYQTCEHPGWPASDACFAVCKLRVELVKRLPEAGTAPWGVEDEADIAHFATPAPTGAAKILPFPGSTPETTPTAIPERRAS